MEQVQPNLARVKPKAIGGAPVKSVNIRISEPLWIIVQGLAKERHQSFNKFAEEALAAAAKESRRLRFRAALEQLAEREQDVEFAFPAQSEAVLGKTDKTG